MKKSPPTHNSRNFFTPPVPPCALPAQPVHEVAHGPWRQALVAPPPTLPSPRPRRCFSSWGDEKHPLRAVHSNPLFMKKQEVQGSSSSSIMKGSSLSCVNYRIYLIAPWTKKSCCGRGSWSGSSSGPARPQRQRRAREAEENQRRRQQQRAAL